MGHITHHAIVVTGDLEEVTAAVAKAQEIGCIVLGPSAEAINGYHTMAICPDGSKAGWSDSDSGDERRQRFMNYLMDTSLEWVEVQYGHDDSRAFVLNTPWPDQHNSPDWFGRRK